MPIERQPDARMDIKKMNNQMVFSDRAGVGIISVVQLVTGINITEGFLESPRESKVLGTNFPRFEFWTRRWCGARHIFVG